MSLETMTTKVKGDVKEFFEKKAKDIGGNHNLSSYLRYLLTKIKEDDKARK